MLSDVYYRSVNGLQNFIGFLEYFDLGNSSVNSSCTETSNLMEDDRLILVSILNILQLCHKLWFSFRGPLFHLFILEVPLATYLQGVSFFHLRWCIIRYDILCCVEPADYFGRKVSLLMSGVLVVLGASLQSSATQGAPW